MNRKELNDLCVEQKLGQGRKVVFESSECYCLGKYLREYAFYPDFLPLFVSTDHGPSQRDEPTLSDLSIDSLVMLYHSKRLFLEWQKKSAIKSEVMFSPFVFYRRTRKVEKTTDAKGTIAFPAHSTDLIDASYDIKKYIDKLLALPEKYQPVSVCLYYKDIQKGLHEYFLKRNIEVHCAGHIYDDAFVERFYEILSKFKYSTSNHLGSYTFYSVEMGIPFFIYGEEITMINKGDPNCPKGRYSPINEFSQRRKATHLFSNIAEDISSEQKQFVEKELGLIHGAGRLSMFFILYYAAVIWFIRKNKSIVNNKIYKLRKVLVTIAESLFIINKGLLRASKIKTHLTGQEKMVLNRLVSKSKKDLTAVEIGSYLGASSCFIAAGLSNNSVLYCIDTWGNHAMKYSENDTDPKERDTYEEFIKNTEKYAHKIRMIRKWTYDAIDDLKKEVQAIDFLFIDGDHNYDGVKKDWDLYSPLLKSGSIVVFHDTGWAEGVKRVVNEDLKDGYTEVKTLPNMRTFKKT